MDAKTGLRFLIGMIVLGIVLYAAWLLITMFALPYPFPVLIMLVLVLVALVFVGNMTGFWGNSPPNA